MKVHKGQLLADGHTTAHKTDMTSGDGRCAATYLEGRKVNNAVDLRVLGKDIVEAGLVSHIDLVEGRALAADKLNAVYGGLGRVDETIDDDDIVTVFEKGEGGEGPNVAGTTAESKPQSISRLPTTMTRATRHTRSHWTERTVTTMGMMMGGCGVPIARARSRRLLWYSRRSTQLLPARRNWSAVRRHRQG